MERDYTSSPVVETTEPKVHAGEWKFRRVLSASTLAGDRVRNTAGEDLGKIEDIMLDIPSGRIAYAVLSFGGFLGIGDKLFAVPWHALTVDEDNHEFVMDVDKKVLENAPGFDKDNWPDMADPNWGAQIHSYYGRKPYWDDSEQYLSDQGEFDRRRMESDKDAERREETFEKEKSYRGGSGL